MVIPKGPDAGQVRDVIVGRMSLVDLAGADAEGLTVTDLQLRKEFADINKSLLVRMGPLCLFVRSFVCSFVRLCVCVCVCVCACVWVRYSPSTPVSLSYFRSIPDVISRRAHYPIPHY